MGQPYKSAFARLRDMPPVFTAAQFMVRQQLDSKHASQYLWRWSSDGLISPLGGRSGVYFNEVICPGAREKYFEVGITKAMPSVLAGGHTVLMESGVSTQFSNNLYLLHPESEKTYCIEKVNLQSRGGVYMRNLFRKGHVLPDSGTILRLNSGAALADLILHDPESAPAPDDIYFDDLDGGALKSLYEMLDVNSAEEGYRVRYRDAHTSSLSMHA